MCHRSRRSPWRLVGVAICAVAGALVSSDVQASEARVALFRAEGFPTVDAPALDPALLDEALAGIPVDRWTTAADLSQQLTASKPSVLVLAYGSAFPAEAWPAIRGYLKSGGGLVVLGGAPFHVPVRSQPGAEGAASWVQGPRQPTYAADLLIGPAEALTRDDAAPHTTKPVAESGWATPFPEPKTTYSLKLRLASRKDTPTDDGSAGPRDAVVRPLVHVVDARGLPRACPLLEVDRLLGDEAGARWVLAPSDARLTAAVVRAAVLRALEGSSEIVARPLRATVEPGEAPILRVSARRPGARAIEGAPERLRVTVTDAAGRTVSTDDVALVGPRESRTGLLTIHPRSPLSPGLYHASVEVPGATTHPSHTTTGFWVRDAPLLAKGPRLTVSRDWLRRDGQVFPLVGTTYMASDVHRKFLFEPNPHVWDLDFAEMKRQGINFVRTGLWTAQGRLMLDPGAIDEAAFSALDAFVLTAARHGIHVCFNFFAFLPPAFAAANPYLDPRALEGQREILTLFASRYRGVPWIHWDLINEPSYAPPSALWSTRPIRDPHERRAFTAWAKARHGDEPLVLRERWRDIDDDLFASPRDQDLSASFLREGRRVRKGRDFQEFTQDAVAGWAARLRDVLRAAGGDPLVTLGQDEGGVGFRPGQQIMAESLDYTSVHTWWNNDDLLWDGVVTKVPEKPSVHQETGLMSLEDMDGFPWRTPEAAASLLERKFAYAFASRGAGAIEWAWNVNPYQPIDNEATIGFFRPDGTAKPELRVVPELSSFFREAAPFLDDFEPDPVVLVIPHSRLFLGRPGGLDATKVVVRLLSDRFGIVPTALSDLRLAAERLRGAKLVLVPSPEAIDERAAQALLVASKAGTKVLVTGAVLGDSYGLETPSLRQLGLLGPSRPLALRESTPWSPSEWVTFEGLKTENLRRSLAPSLSSFGGNLWHEPLPLEFARETEPLARLLAAALAAAGVEADPTDSLVTTRVLVAPKAALVVLANERPSDARRRVRVGRKIYEVPVAAYGARLVLIERSTGRVLVVTPGAPVTPVG
jgi:hypothetical protein